MKDADGKHVDPIRPESEAGKQPADVRLLIVRLLELEAINPADLTSQQSEALTLWQGQIGDQNERNDTAEQFIRAGGALIRFIEFLRACGLNDHAEEIDAVVVKALEALGWRRPAPPGE